MQDQPNQKKSILHFFAGWPIIGRLWEVPSEALKEARAEVVSATFFATMPFWFLPIIGAIIFAKRPSFWEAFVSGELFIYAAALVGPLAYIITKRYGRFKVPTDLEEGEMDGQLSYPFPYGRQSFYAASFICIMSGLIFTIQRIKTTTDQSIGDLINVNGLVVLSIVVAILGTILLFSVTAYRNMLEALERRHSDRISGALKQDEDGAYAQWIERKENA